MTWVPDQYVSQKLLLVPDCDDDRYDHDRRVYINPRHARAWQEVYCKEWVREKGVMVRAYQDHHGELVPLAPEDGGNVWSPAFSLVIENGERRIVRGDELAMSKASAKPLRFRGGVQVSWLRSSSGAHRISVWGADDHGLEKVGLPEAKARALWDRLRDFVTHRTLERLGFKRC